MFRFKKKKNTTKEASPAEQSREDKQGVLAGEPADKAAVPEASEEKPGFFSRFKRQKKANSVQEGQPEAPPVEKPLQESSVLAPPAPVVEGASKPQEKAKPHSEKSLAPESQQRKTGRWRQFKQGLGKTRNQFSTGLGRLFLGKKTIDEALYEDIETQLLCADLGVETTQYVIAELIAQTHRKQLKDPAALYTQLKGLLASLLAPCQQPFSLPENRTSPFVILMIGINGAGKTTTIGKLARQFCAQGKSVMMAAGDTFRAAAAEQLQAWGERNDVKVVSHASGTDSASVIFEGVKAAHEAKVDVLLADTAGRLHTKGNLMEELKKVKRVAGKIDARAPQETWLVLDASVGQNALIQAKEFHKAVGVTGIILTKLDGTAKGGVIFAIAEQLKLPICYIGLGEGIEDLRPFEAEAFINALFETTEDKL